MSTLKQTAQFGVIVSLDLALGTTIGHFIDSWFPYMPLDPGVTEEKKWNTIFKDVVLTVIQGTVTVFLGTALRKDLLGDDYLANDTSNGAAMIVAMFRQDNFWRRIDNIYQTLAGFDDNGSPSAKTPSDMVPTIETHHPVHQAFGNDI